MFSFEGKFNLINENATQQLAALIANGIDNWHSQSECHLLLGTNTSHASLQIQFKGELGAGKTAFVRAILHALGHNGRVPSPTYTLVEPYQLKRPAGLLLAYHFDLYRFNDPNEWLDSGFNEYIDTHAVCFIEWPEKADTLLAKPDLLFSLKVIDEQQRQLLITAFSDKGKMILKNVN